MFEFENDTFEDIYYSRFIASWIKSGGGKIDYRFKEWLSSLTINDKKIPEDVIQRIYYLGTNGKMELEGNVKWFLKN